MVKIHLMNLKNARFFKLKALKRAVFLKMTQKWSRPLVIKTDKVVGDGESSKSESEKYPHKSLHLVAAGLLAALS